MTALHVVVRQNRAAHNGKIGVRADEIMREHADKIKKLSERSVVDLHRNVLFGKGDTMLVVVNVGRILQIPLVARKRDRNDAVILTGGGVDSARISFIFTAQKAFRITALRKRFCRRDGFRVLFGLRKVDGDVNLAVFAFGLPFHILFNAIVADIIGCFGKGIIIIGRLFGAFFVKRIKLFDHRTRERRERAHELCVEKIAVHDRIVFQKPVLCRLVAKRFENRFKVGAGFERLIAYRIGF